MTFCNTLEYIKLSDKLELSHCRDGYWLWDKTQGMNLAMRAKTEREAFVEALKYYQNRQPEIEKELKDLKAKVNRFLSEVLPECDEYED